MYSTIVKFWANVFGSGSGGGGAINSKVTLLAKILVKESWINNSTVKVSSENADSSMLMFCSVTVSLKKIEFCLRA